MAKNALLPIGEVKLVETKGSKDCLDGTRIKAVIDGDNPRNIASIPWAVPLLPKVFQSIPKVGEAVIIITAQMGDKDSQRFYIGPIIPQPQYFEKSPKKNATSMLQTAETTPLAAISNFAVTDGSFPSNEDIAVIGRGGEDIVLKYNSSTSDSEVDIRAGIRQRATSSSDAAIRDKLVVFNTETPTYIQLKNKKGIAPKHDASSLVNIVGEKVNIMSTQDSDVSASITDNKELVKSNEADNIMDKLHQVPKGDTLIEFLEVLRQAVLLHVHPWLGMEQCGDHGGYINKLKDYDLQSLLSDHVRIS